jgi:hypothetical protein
MTVLLLARLCYGQVHIELWKIPVKLTRKVFESILEEIAGCGNKNLVMIAWKMEQNLSTFYKPHQT